MATADIFQTASLPLRPGHATALHPLAPLSATEVTASRDAIQSIYPPQTGLLFKQITLKEPLKAELAPYLDAEYAGVATGKIDRRAFITYYIRNTVGQNLSNCIMEMIARLLEQIS